MDLAAEFHRLGLSKGETKVAVNLASGLTLDETAGRLCISNKAVKFHTTSIYKKLGFKNRNQFFVFCAKNFQEFYRELDKQELAKKVEAEKVIDPEPIYVEQLQVKPGGLPKGVGI